MTKCCRRRFLTFSHVPRKRSEISNWMWFAFDVFPSTASCCVTWHDAKERYSKNYCGGSFASDERAENNESCNVNTNLIKNQALDIQRLSTGSGLASPRLRVGKGNGRVSKTSLRMILIIQRADKLLLRFSEPGELGSFVYNEMRKGSLVVFVSRFLMFCGFNWRPIWVTRIPMIVTTRWHSHPLTHRFFCTNQQKSLSGAFV